MQIPEKLQRKWKDLRNEGDADKIAIEAGVTGATIRNAFRLGKCNEEVFTAMSKFYEKKSKTRKKVRMTSSQKSKLLNSLKDAISILEADGVKPKKKGLNNDELFIKLSKYPNKKPCDNRA